MLSEFAKGRFVKIGKIWDSEFPWDVRVEKVCGALLAAGHQVHMICRNRDRRPLEEEWKGVRLHRMPVWRSWPRSAERAASFPAFANPRWFGLMNRVFRQHSVDVLLCRDLPLTPLALAVGRQLKRPVVIDVAEHYPGLLRDLYNPHDFKLLNLVVRNPRLAAAVERFTLPRAQGVLVVVEEMRDRLVALGVPSDRITVVSNTPTRERISRMASIQRSQPRAADALRMVYLGKIERSRGLGFVIEALAESAVSLPWLTLDVFGAGSSLEAHRTDVVRRGLSGRVTFHGWTPYEEVLERLGVFDVGIIPHFATDHWNYTIQNKLFDYMAAGLAVLVSSMRPAARIVAETGAGVVFQDRDRNSLLSELARLLDPALRQVMGARGRRAVSERYHWELDGARLVAALERTVDSGQRTTEARGVTAAK